MTESLNVTPRPSWGVFGPPPRRGIEIRGFHSGGFSGAFLTSVLFGTISKMAEIIRDFQSEYFFGGFLIPNVF